MICCSQEKRSEVRTGVKGLVRVVPHLLHRGWRELFPQGNQLHLHPEGMAYHFFFFFCLGVLSLSENSVLLVPKGQLRP